MIRAEIAIVYHVVVALGLLVLAPQIVPLHPRALVTDPFAALIGLALAHRCFQEARRSSLGGMVGYYAIACIAIYVVCDVALCEYMATHPEFTIQKTVMYRAATLASAQV